MTSPALATTYEVNVYGAIVAVAALIVAALIVLALLRRGGKVTTPFGSLDIAQQQQMAADLAEVKARTTSIDHAVNSKGPQEQPIKVHAEQAATHSGETRQRVIALEGRMEQVEDGVADNRTMTRHLVADVAEIKAAVTNKRQRPAAGAGRSTNPPTPRTRRTKGT